MKTIASLAVVLGALMATGCATDGDAYSRNVAPAQPGEIVVDDHYVAAVEQAARRRGTWVEWVNVPTRRVEQTLTAD